MLNQPPKLFQIGPGLFVFLSCIVFSCNQQPASPQGSQRSEDIRLNQIGFYPHAPKIVVISTEAEGEFHITTPDLQETVFTGTLSAPRSADFSPKTTRIADFSDFKQTGTFVVLVPETGHSYPFEIQPQVHKEVADASLKGFYFQRVSTALPETYAGKWSRAAGHPDTEVQVHASAASAQRPEGTVIASPQGWYDAGDYNKYIVNSGITMGTLLSLYEDFSAYFDTLQLNIPENTNDIPDLLDEVLWNLRWMLTMQDPHDEGVYHKMTAANFEGMVMPVDAKAIRYVVQKSTAAALDFAAVMAQAHRVFGNFDQALPGLADSCLQAAENAWAWAQKNPEVMYNQRSLNEEYDPDITTGAYGDRNLSDEWIWAAAELYVTTRDENYYTAVEMFPDDTMPLPAWGQVRLLGYYTLARFSDALTGKAQEDFHMLKERLIAFADGLIAGVNDQYYHTVMGQSAKDFIWGSNSVAANQGIALLQAYQLTHDKKYIDYALTNLDYLLGRNATGYSFLTGYGDKPTMYPHHRPSEADGLDEPIPGLLAGGPNPGQQDDCDYPSDVPDESYVDAECSYASNEIAINWNAPFVYLASALEALQFQVGYVEEE